MTGTVSVENRKFIEDKRKFRQTPGRELEQLERLCFDLAFHEEAATMSVPQKSYDEIVDLFARTSSAEILSFRPSIESQERVRYLLARNASGELTEDEAAELERFGELEHLMHLVEARAQIYMESQS